MANSRRDVLKGLTAGLVSASIFSAVEAGAGASQTRMDEIRQQIRISLGAILMEEVEPRIVGRSYLSLYPEEAHIDRLLSELGECLATPRVDEMEAHLAQLRQRDFEAGEIAIVEGWILARTEARACALLALL